MSSTQVDRMEQYSNGVMIGHIFSMHIWNFWGLVPLIHRSNIWMKFNLTSTVMAF